jgi:hypothetical protein
MQAQLRDALKQCRQLQDLVASVETRMHLLQDLVASVETRPQQVHALTAKRSAPPTASERTPVDGACVSNVEETMVTYDTPTSQQQQTRREQELSVELEQARQQIKILQQVL